MLLRHTRAGFGVFGIGLLLAVGAARAESPQQVDPPFHFLRYNDDFSNLANKSEPSLWERFKYIPFGMSSYGASYLSLGGELRERFETYQHPNYGFGKTTPASNGYLLERFNFNADLHITDYFRSFVQLGDDRIFGHRGVTSSTDVDRWDLMQRFVEVRLPSPFGDDPTLRYGREELAFGYQRLIAAREGPNVRRDFDGFRASDTIGEAKIDVLSVQPTIDSPYALSDETNPTQHLGGVYVTTPVAGPLKTDLYALTYDNTSTKLRGVTGVEKVLTLGFRAFGKANGFDWNVEASDQTGKFNTTDVQAYLLAAVAGYTWEDALWTPRLGFSANDASGDNAHSKTIGTFNAMYPRLPYFAETPLLVPSNVRDIREVVSFVPVQNVNVIFGYDMLWRSSETDGLYGSGFVMMANTNKVTGSRVGSEFSVDVRWQANQFVQLGAILAQFQSGPAITEAGGKNMTYGVLFAKLKF